MVRGVFGVYIKFHDDDNDGHMADIHTSTQKGTKRTPHRRLKLQRDCSSSSSSNISLDATPANAMTMMTTVCACVCVGPLSAVALTLNSSNVCVCVCVVSNGELAKLRLENVRTATARQRMMYTIDVCDVDTGYPYASSFWMLLFVRSECSRQNQPQQRIYLRTQSK